MTTATQCPFAVYDYPCGKRDCSRCTIWVEATAKAREGIEPEESPIGGKCYFCGKFVPHDSGHHNLRYIGEHGDVYVCPECQQ